MAIFHLAVVLQTPNNAAHRNWHIAGIFECYQPSFNLQLPVNCLALKQSRFYDYIPVDLHRPGRLLRSNKRSTASRKRGQTSNINETSFTFDFTEIRLLKETILIHLFDLFVHRGRSFANSPHSLLYNSVRSSEKYPSEVFFDCAHFLAELPRLMIQRLQALYFPPYARLHFVNFVVCFNGCQWKFKSCFPRQIAK